MDEFLGHHRADDGDVVGDAGGIRQKIRDLGPRLAVPFKLSPGAKQPGVLIDDGEPFAFDVRLGNRLDQLLNFFIG